MNASALRKKATIHQITTMLATSKNVLFPGHNLLLTTTGARVIINVLCHQYQWLAIVVCSWLWPGNRTFLEVASKVVSYLVDSKFLCSARHRHKYKITTAMQLVPTQHIHVIYLHQREIHVSLPSLTWKTVHMRECWVISFADFLSVGEKHIRGFQEICGKNKGLLHFDRKKILNSILSNVFHETYLALKVLNFWKFTSKRCGWLCYCSLKPLWSGVGEVPPARTSPTLHPPSPSTVL